MDLSSINKNTILLVAGFGLVIGTVLRLVTQPNSHLLFTLAIGFSAGLVPVALLVVAVLAIIFSPQVSAKQSGEQSLFYEIIVMLIYIIVCGGPAGLFGLLLAVFMLILDIVIGQPLASLFGWVLSGALYGAIWGVGVMTWFKFRNRSRRQA